MVKNILKQYGVWDIDCIRINHFLTFYFTISLLSSITIKEEGMWEKNE